MHHRITTTLRHLRQDLAELLQERAIHDACRQAGHTCRPCLLTPLAILHWFLIEVLNGNTALVHASLLGRGWVRLAATVVAGRRPGRSAAVRTADELRQRSPARVAVPRLQALPDGDHDDDQAGHRIGP